MIENIIYPCVTYKISLGFSILVISVSYFLFFAFFSFRKLAYYFVVVLNLIVMMGCVGTKYFAMTRKSADCRDNSIVIRNLRL